MSSTTQIVKIVIFVPESHADAVRKALGESGGGVIGNYDFCSFSIKGIGRFKPLEGANPFIGSVGNLESVDEERIETPIERGKLKKVIAAVKAAHPYEEPVIEVYQMEDLSSL